MEEVVQLEDPGVGGRILLKLLEGKNGGLDWNDFASDREKVADFYIDGDEYLVYIICMKLLSQLRNC
jgi:hypothetical protein